MCLVGFIVDVPHIRTTYKYNIFSNVMSMKRITHDALVQNIFNENTVKPLDTMTMLNLKI